jgi:head-tail adaptor
VSKRNHKAIFERKAPRDEWSGAADSWQNIHTEWVSLEPLTGREYFQAAQVQAQSSVKCGMQWSPSAALVTTDCRMKIRKPVAVNENEPDADENFRLFEIENITNPGEMNRELELMVQEKV